MHPMGKQALLGQVAEQMKRRLAVIGIEVWVEFDEDFDDHAVWVEGRDALGRAAWGQYSVPEVEGVSREGLPLGGMWCAFNEDGQKAWCQNGDLAMFARWWRPTA